MQNRIPRFSDLILHEDDDLLVINKPPYISSLDERNGEGPSILGLARRYHAAAQLCHRIDKETSGLLVIAKHPEAYRAISMLFESRAVGKLYHAVVQGQAHFDETPVELPLYVNPRGAVSVDFGRGKETVTVFHTLQHFGHFTLVGCQPLTGRQHQIRVHLAAQNHSIVADELYGGKKPMLSDYKRRFKTAKWTNEEPMMKRTALHALQLHFVLGEKEYEFTAPYPKDFDVFLKLLEKYDPA